MAVPDIQTLQWDSENFGISIGKVQYGNAVDFNAEELDSVLKSSPHQLIYLVSDFELPDLSLSNIKSVELVDRKVTFLKEHEGKPTLDSESAVVDLFGSDLTEDLLELAYLSGIYSRYKVDSKFPDEKFHFLYKEWIRKSLSGELAQNVFAVVDNGQVLGMTTLGKKGERGDIGLVAVDPGAQGKGYASQLLRKAIAVSSKRGDPAIQVVTQLDNVAACKAYLKNGFHQDNVEFIYHIWK